MDSVFGSPKMQRQPLRINNRRSVKQHFEFNSTLGYKSKAASSVVTWRGPGRGVQGESVNAQNQGSKQIINRNWRPV
jgi:hypothetical protein